MYSGHTYLPASDRETLDRETRSSLSEKLTSWKRTSFRAGRRRRKRREEEEGGRGVSQKHPTEYLEMHYDTFAPLRVFVSVWKDSGTETYKTDRFVSSSANVSSPTPPCVLYTAHHATAPY